MSAIGGQPGNSNAAKGKPWATAIARALGKRSLIAQKEALDELAETLLAQCDKGDITAFRELGNRLDGLPQQSVTLSGDPDKPLLDYATIIARFADKLAGRTLEHAPQPAIEALGSDREILGHDTSNPVIEPD